MLYDWMTLYSHGIYRYDPYGYGRYGYDLYDCGLIVMASEKNGLRRHVVLRPLLPLGVGRAGRMRTARLNDPIHLVLCTYGHV